MTQEVITPMQRVLTTLGHNEPDRVPFFLLLTMHGAKELGLSIKEYFSRPENVVEGQLRMRAKYGHDCLYSLFYAAADVEAWGAETIFRDDGPPNSGDPIISKPEDIAHLERPNVMEAACLTIDIQEKIRGKRLVWTRKHERFIIPSGCWVEGRDLSCSSGYALPEACARP